MKRYPTGFVFWISTANCQSSTAMSSKSLSLSLWEFMFILNVKGFINTMEKYLWVWLWGCWQKGKTQPERRQQGPIGWGLRLKIGRKLTEHQHSPLCLQCDQPTLLCFPHSDRLYPTLLQAKTNPPSIKLLLVRYLVSVLPDSHRMLASSYFLSVYSSFSNKPTY